MITFTIKLFEIKFKKVFVKLWKFFSKKVNDRKLRSVETAENLILLMKIHRKNLPTEKLNEKLMADLIKTWRRF